MEPDDRRPAHSLKPVLHKPGRRRGFASKTRRPHPQIRSMKEALYKEGPRFEFYQAVKLLELLKPGSISVGEGMRPDQEAVRFSSTVEYGFTGTEIEKVEAASNDRPPTMQVNFMGLVGTQGPLPAPFMRLLVDRRHEGDASMADFLDIFNHRLVSLMYRVHKTHRVGFAADSPGEGRFASYLYALIGLGTPGLSNRLPVPDVVLLRYAGLLAQYPRSAVGLECILADYFKTEVHVQQLRGHWLKLDCEEWTAIGLTRTGRNQVLGQNFLLGRRIYDLQGKLEIQLGPLDLQPYLDLLPGGPAFQALGALSNFYLQNALTFDLRLSLRAAQVPGFRLSTVNGYGSRLAWTSWLKTQSFCADAEVSLSRIPLWLREGVDGFIR